MICADAALLMLTLLLLSLLCQNGRGNGNCKFGESYHGRKIKINILLIPKKEETGGHKYMAFNNIEELVWS